LASLTYEQHEATLALAAAANGLADASGVAWDILVKDVAQACHDHWEDTLEQGLASEVPAGYHVEGDLMDYFSPASDDAGEVSFAELEHVMVEQAVLNAARAALDPSEVVSAFEGVTRAPVCEIYKEGVVVEVMSS